MPAGPLLMIATGLGAFTLSWLAVGLVRTLALRHGMLDVPNARSSHVQPTPRLGGVGILVAIVVIVLVVGATWELLTREIAILLTLGTAVSLVSLIDDMRGLSPVARLVVHLAIAALVVRWLGSLSLTLPGGLAGPNTGVLASGLTVLWVAGFINAFNFMDGTDGIAGMQAVVAASAWGVAAWWLNQPSVAVLATGTAAASAGFLLHNWSPANTFMGDVGSALLGLLLAVLPLMMDPPQPLLTAALPVWPFVFDTTFTLLRRARRGENLLAAHRSHLYQRLTASGWPHGRTAIVYGALALAGALVAVPMAAGVLRTPFVALLVLAVGSGLLWTLVVWHEARQDGNMRMVPARREDDA